MPKTKKSESEVDETAFIPIDGGTEIIAAELHTEAKVLPPRSAFYEASFKDRKVPGVQHWGLIDAAHRLYGGIKCIENNLIEHNEGMNATVKCTIEFQEGQVFSAHGNANKQNIHRTALHPFLLAMAETRAESRCLLKALNIGEFVHDTSDLEAYLMGEAEEENEMGNFVKEVEGKLKEMTPEINKLNVDFERPEDDKRGRLFDFIMKHLGEDKAKLLLISVAHHNKKTSTAYLSQETYMDIVRNFKNNS